MTAVFGFARRALVPLMAIAVVALIPRLITSFWLFVLTEGLILGLAAAALDVQMGYAGLVSLGQAAFFGMGGYGVGLVILRLEWSPWVALLVALGITATAGALFGLVAIRTRGIYFLVITLAFGQVLWGVAVKWTRFTGGYNGLTGVPRPGGFGLNLSGTTSYYYAVLIVVAAVLAVLHVLVRSPVGLSFRGTRLNETRMSLLGYRPSVYRWTAFTLAATIAGLAGCLNAFLTGFVGPDSLFWTLSAEMLLIVIVGGAGTVWGAAAAGVVLTLIRTQVTTVSVRWGAILGLLYVATVLIAPTGWFRAGLSALRRLRMFASPGGPT